MKNTFSIQIKKLARAYGKVDVRVSTYGTTVTVKFLSRPSQELVEEIRKLQTIEAHGDSMNDTRWYSGYSIQMRYDFPVSETDQAAFDLLKVRYPSTNYSATLLFESVVLEDFGPIVGRRFLDKINYCL